MMGADQSQYPRVAGSATIRAPQFCSDESSYARACAHSLFSHKHSVLLPLPFIHRNLGSF